MKTLVLITSAFPFGSGESFIESELPFLHKEFDRVIIIARNVSAPITRRVPDDVVIFRYNTAATFHEFLRLPFLLAKYSPFISEIIGQELSYRKTLSAPLRLSQKIFLLRKLVKALQFKEFIENKLKCLGISTDIIFYSYWFTTSAHSISMIDYKRSIKLSRAHGSDLYEEASPHRYLPLLKFISGKLDAIFFVSESGKIYFRSKAGMDSSHMIVSRLGIPSSLFRIPVVTETAIFTIVSCSSLIPLKRVWMIIAALGYIKSTKKIKWIHFGNGPLKSILETKASDTLGIYENISYEFWGEIPNREILDFYAKNRVNLFINTSSTEGIPVSIMEAQAFGIPVIAMNTGGVGEIVSDDTGCLLPVNSTPEEVAAKINYFIDMNLEDQVRLSEKIILTSKEKYNADENYPDFIKKVNSIFELSRLKSE